MNLLPGECLDFVRTADRILAIREFHGLAVDHAINRNIHRHIVAIHQFQLEEDQLRFGGMEAETIPVFRRIDTCPCAACRAPGNTRLRPRMRRPSAPSIIGEAPCQEWFPPCLSDADSGSGLICTAIRSAHSRCGESQLRRGSLRQTKRRIQIAIAGMQGLGEQHAAAISQRDFQP